MEKIALGPRQPRFILLANGAIRNPRVTKL